MRHISVAVLFRLCNFGIGQIYILFDLILYVPVNNYVPQFEGYWCSPTALASPPVIL